MKLAGYKDRYKISDTFDFRPNWTVVVELLAFDCHSFFSIDLMGKML